ncbi:MAG: DegT/DnrJ/EryC1/StrS family aminotransferase [Acidimicrobiales bacterium]|nr:DegT/DnrJ/EryC1/StrS family aminotransferase [Acidimicrobiales bacterium]
MLRYSRQTIDDDDVAAVGAVLRSDWLTTGPAVEAFEAALVAHTGAAHAVAFANGTAALHAAAAAAGLGPGDRVATSPLSFVASANCARYVGATPIFVDIDPTTLNLDPARVPADVDALVAVHYAGLPVDLGALAHRPRVIIEDAAHAIGARTPDGPVGNCARSDLTCFSFHPVKPMTTAEGGAVTTNDDDLAAALRRFRNHGIVPTPERGPWAYDVVETGFNYRLTDLQAALGTSQLAKLEGFTVARNVAAERYRDLLADAPVQLPPAAPEGWRHAHHLFAVRVADRRAAYDALAAADIGAQVHYVPIHHHTAMAPYGPFDLPAADEAYEHLLSLPLYPGIEPADQERVIAALESVW